MLTVRTSENTVITSFRLISERQDFSSVRTGENTVRARARIHNGACAAQTLKKPREVESVDVLGQAAKKRGCDVKKKRKIQNRFAAVLIAQRSENNLADRQPDHTKCQA